MQNQGRGSYGISFIGIFALVGAILIAALGMVNASNAASPLVIMYIVFLMFLVIGLMLFIAFGAFLEFKPTARTFTLIILNGLLAFSVISLISFGIQFVSRETFSVETEFSLLAPVSEELFFRGFIFRIFDLAGLWWLGTGVSAVSFAIFHSGVYGLLANPTILAILIIAGIIYCLVYKATRYIDTPILAHFINNLVASI